MGISPPLPHGKNLEHCVGRGYHRYSAQPTSNSKLPIIPILRQCVNLLSLFDGVVNELGVVAWAGIDQRQGV